MNTLHDIRGDDRGLARTPDRQAPPRRHIAAPTSERSVIRIALRYTSAFLAAAVLIAALQGPGIAWVEEDDPIGGAPISADPVEEGRPLRGRPVYGGPAWDPPLGGATLGGEPVEDGWPLEGGTIGGEPAEEHRPLEGGPLY
jgi:hypothetical protein